MSIGVLFFLLADEETKAWKGCAEGGIEEFTATLQCQINTNNFILRPQHTCRPSLSHSEQEVNTRPFRMRSWHTQDLPPAKPEKRDGCGHWRAGRSSTDKEGSQKSLNCWPGGHSSHQVPSWTSAGCYQHSSSRKAGGGSSISERWVGREGNECGKASLLCPHCPVRDIYLYFTTVFCGTGWRPDPG